MENHHATQDAVNGFIYGYKFTKLTSRGVVKPVVLYLDTQDPRFLRKISGNKMSKTRLVIRALKVSSPTKIKNRNTVKLKDDSRNKILTLVVENSQEQAFINNGILGLKISGENLLLDCGEFWRLDERIRDMDFFDLGVKALGQICGRLDRELGVEDILGRVGVIEGAGQKMIKTEDGVLKF